MNIIFSKNGGAGNRTPCLSHAKRALYHMSYTPMLNIMAVSLLYISLSVTDSPNAVATIVEYSGATPPAQLRLDQEKKRSTHFCSSSLPIPGGSEKVLQVVPGVEFSTGKTNNPFYDAER